MKNIRIIRILMAITFLSWSGVMASAGQLGYVDRSAGKLRMGGATQGRLLINEVMASNENPVQDEDGDSVAWIELYNGTGSAINLEGYSIVNDDADWNFPAAMISSGEYYLVFASGKNRTGIELHTNFRISDKGDKLILRDSTGMIVDEIFTGEMPRGLSRGRIQEQFDLMEPTPGQDNTARSMSYTVMINEVMTNNASTLADLDGQYKGWVELRNIGFFAVNLEGLVLEHAGQSSNLPGIVLDPDSYQVIFLSGKSDVHPASGEFHADFEWQSGVSILKLTDAEGVIIDQMVITPMPENMSKGRLDDRPWTVVYFENPTPGEANDSIGATRRRLEIQQAVKK
jgi:hypothetical protein